MKTLAALAVVMKIGIPAEITTGATFLETYARHTLAFQAYGRKQTGNPRLELPLAIMTSGDPHKATVELLEPEQYFGLAPSQVTLMQLREAGSGLHLLAALAKERVAWQESMPRRSGAPIVPARRPSRWCLPSGTRPCASAAPRGLGRLAACVLSGADQSTTRGHAGTLTGHVSAARA